MSVNVYDDDEEQMSNNFFVNFYYNNKILIWIFGAIIIFIILMSLLTRGGSNGNDNILHGVKIYPEGDIYVNVGKSTNLSAVVENDPKGVVTWSVDNTDVVKVDNGNVVGLDYGKAIVTATYIDSDNKKYTDTKNVTVADGDPNVTLKDVSFKNGDLYMPLNETYEIALTLIPSRGYVENEVFTSSNKSVVTVDNKGMVTSVGEGHAKITFSVNNGKFKKELDVYVDRAFTKKEIVVTPERIDIDGVVRKIKIGGKEKLSYSITPSDADTSKLIWKSSNDAIVTVDNGTITGVKDGRATITVSALNGEMDKIEIEVEKKIVDVKSISLSTSTINLEIAESKTIKPTVSPTDASNKALSYTSLNTSVAYVMANNTGTSATIIGVREGTTTILIESNNNIKKKVTVNVTDSRKQATPKPNTPTPYNGSSNGGSSNSGSSGSSSSTQGFEITSKDANGGRYITTGHTGKVNNNGATAPVEVTVTKTNSSVSKLVILVCNYSSASSCGGLGRYTTTDTYSFQIKNTGDYVIRVEEYDSYGNRIRSTDKYIWVKAVKGGTSGSSSSTSTVSYTVSPKLYDNEMGARGNPYSVNTTIKFTKTGSNGHIKLCWGVFQSGKVCVPSLEVNDYKNVTFTQKGLIQIGIARYNSSNTLIDKVYKYIYVS